MGNTLDKINASGVAFENYAKAAPDFLNAFNQLGEAAFKDSPLDFKTSELIIVAIAIASLNVYACIMHIIQEVVKRGSEFIF